MKRKVVELLGGKCKGCGNTDIRVLQINHLNGGGRKEVAGPLFYARILSGERAIDDLDLRCANCNIIYEYEVGRRAVA